MRSLPAPALPAPIAAGPLHRRPIQVAALLLAVLLMHGLVFLAVAPGGGRAPGAMAPPRPAVTVLTLAPRAAPPTQSAVPVSPQALPSIDKAAERPREKPAPTRNQGLRVAAAAAAAPRPDAAQPALSPAGSAGESAALPIAAIPAAPQPPSSDVAAVPVYVTKLPESAHLHFQLQRGASVGSGQLVWQRQGGAYEISLEGELQGMPVLGSLSRGVIDIDGVAPLRMADRRRSRELRAVNFQRDAQRITFSGPQVEYPLLAGAQDRLSWMIQLPGIVEADPLLTQAGARVTLFVVGTRGDAEAWHFEVQGSQALELPAGAVHNALHLLREPKRPYDTRVEVWLDPARQHLPVRAVLTTVPGGQPLEFKLARVGQAAL